MTGPPHPCALSSPSTWKVLLALPPEVKACAEAAFLKRVLPPLPNVSAQTLLLGGWRAPKATGWGSVPALPALPFQRRDQLPAWGLVLLGREQTPAALALLPCPSQPGCRNKYTFLPLFLPGLGAGKSRIPGGRQVGAGEGGALAAYSRGREQVLGFPPVMRTLIPAQAPPS